ATPDGMPLIVEPMKREDTRKPLDIEEDDEEIALLTGGRTATRPNPLPLDGFQMVEELAVESSSNNRAADEDTGGGLAGLDALLGKLSLAESDEE
ncbi:MAG: hypothetical protein JWL77_5336, partial [Chthonomonadaceae bacterium]|nr:hypothetical protein [Chthonomonadaceae bacterium]